jgi:hypothetical protein
VDLIEIVSKLEPTYQKLLDSNSTFLASCSLLIGIKRRNGILL